MKEMLKQSGVRAGVERKRLPRGLESWAHEFQGDPAGGVQQRAALHGDPVEGGAECQEQEAG